MVGVAVGVKVLVLVAVTVVVEVLVGVLVIVAVKVCVLVGVLLAKGRKFIIGIDANIRKITTSTIQRTSKIIRHERCFLGKGVSARLTRSRAWKNAWRLAAS